MTSGFDWEALPHWGSRRTTQGNCKHQPRNFKYKHTQKWKKHLNGRKEYKGSFLTSLFLFRSYVYDTSVEIIWKQLILMKRCFCKPHGECKDAWNCWHNLHGRRFPLALNSHTMRLGIHPSLCTWSPLMVSRFFILFYFMCMRVCLIRYITCVPGIQGRQ